MSAKRSVITVASPPAKPLLIYDGECNFCKFWILHWQRFTRGRVDYAASQKMQTAKRFPELPQKRFEESVQFIETDGRVYDGAEAVFRTLTYGWCGGLFLGLYQQIPGFAPVAEWAYHFVARRRTAFSFLTRMLWGREGALPSYRLTSWLFLRFLGVIYLCAFASLGTQIIGLIGKGGILPAGNLMAGAREQFDGAKIGWDRYHVLPTLCWFSASDGFLRLLCLAGCALAILLIANVAPAPCLFLLWLIYLSLASVGREFLAFQWDALLLETGLLAIFFAPLHLLPGWAKPLHKRSPLIPALWLPKPATIQLPQNDDALRAKWSPSGGEGGKSSKVYCASPEPSRVALWLLRWLLFRLMLESGLVKLISGDPTWQGLTALNYHYETQPLPTWAGWYAHQLPGGFQRACVMIMFLIELRVPYLIFLPRRVRFAGCGLLILLQGVILLTGNYCFFNLLTIALCLLLLDDAALRKLVPARWRRPEATVEISPETGKPKTLPEITVPDVPVVPERRRWRWPVWVTLPVALVVLWITAPQVWNMLHGVRARAGRPGEEEIGAEANSAGQKTIYKWRKALYEWRKEVEEWLQPFSSVNTYGLFAVMTTSRPEIIIEGSNDKKTWLPYEFKYKPGDLTRRPGFVAPHQPRLDWQMWFAALGNYQQNRWFVNFCVRLLEGSPEVLKLMEKNPFPDAPPRYLRAQVYDYHFSDFKQRRVDGVWWRREYRGEYLPVISLRENP